MIWPVVLSEFDTLTAVSCGRSLARFGDGELNLARGFDIPCQRVSNRLRDRLRGILLDSGDCLVGIPNVTSDGPKANFWSKYRAFTDLLADRMYASAFISRPDSAPWIDEPQYWLLLEQLWAGQDVTLVRSESQKALQLEDLSSARSVREVLAPKTNAFAVYDAILDDIGEPTGPVLLCLGPTATVLAVDLCAAGVHVIDLGHVAAFWRKHRRGEPAVALTVAEKARDF